MPIGNKMIGVKKKYDYKPFVKLNLIFWCPDMMTLIFLKNLIFKMSKKKLYIEFLKWVAAING